MAANDLIRHIAKTASEFDDYLASVRGPDSSLAKESQLRDDTHDQDTPAPKKDYGSKSSPRPKSGYLSPSYGRHTPRKARAGSSTSKRSEKDNSDDDLTLIQLVILAVFTGNVR